MVASLLLALVALPQSTHPSAIAELEGSAARLNAIGGEAKVSFHEDPRGEIWFDLTGKIKTPDLKLLQGVKRLTAVRIFSEDLTDKMVGDIRGNPDLNLLVVMSSKLTDKCTEPISRMAGLTKLDINKATLSKVGLGRLGSLKKLERLYLYNAKIADAEMAPLKKLTHLKLLDLPPSCSEATVSGLRTALQKTEIVCRRG